MSPQAPRPRELIGVVHLLPLPGAPGFSGNLAPVVAQAEADAVSLQAGGLRAAIVENFGDRPFFKDRVPAETVASMARCVLAVQRAAPQLRIGINVLRNDARAALGLAAALGAQFIRINVHVGVMLTDQGLIEGQAAETLRERARLAPGVELWCDVHVKHAVPLGGEDLIDAARNTAERGLADALILSGRATGSAPAAAEVERLRAACPGVRLLLGSGLHADNAAELLRHADGAIVGTALKQAGRVENPVDVQRVRLLCAVVAGL
jgi:uncharacterized protein